MHRREVLRTLGSIAAGSMLSRLSPDRLYALGCETHQRLVAHAAAHAVERMKRREL
jgi:hypothetical protein